MPPSRFGQVSRYRNATLSTAKAHERFTELGLASLPDNGAGRLLAVAPVSGHVFARSSSGTNALLVVHPDAPQKYAKQPPLLHGVSQGSLADFDVSRFQDDERHAVLAAGSSQGSITVRRVTLPEVGVKSTIESSDERVLPAASSGAGTATAVRFHPSSAPILLSASNASSKVRVFDVGAQQNASPVLEWDAEIPQWDVAWSTSGALVGGAGKDLAIRLWDARQTKAVAKFNAHASKVKPTKVTFISETAEHLLLTTGFSQMRQREIAIWDQRKSSSPLKRITLDVASSSLDPICEHDRGIVYLTAKGDSSVRWIDVGSQDQGDNFAEGTYPLDFSAASGALAPQAKADTGKGEIANLLVATVPGGGGASSSDAIVPCSVQVPRRNYIDFHADLYPDTTLRNGSGIASAAWLDGGSASVEKVTMDPSVARRTPAMSVQTPAAQKAAPMETREPTVRSREVSPVPQGVTTPVEKIACTSRSSGQPAAVASGSGTQVPATAMKGSAEPSAAAVAPANASTTSSTISNGSATPAKSASRAPTVNLHWSRKPLAGSTPLIAAHQNLSGLDLSRGPDARMLVASRRHLFVPLSGPGGRLGVHPLELHGRLPLHLPCFVHGSPLIDFCVDPFNDDQVITVAQDGVLRLWRVPQTVKDKDGQSSLPSLDNEKPVTSIALSSATKLGTLLPHPFVGSLVAILPGDASGQIIFADLATKDIVATLDAPGDGCFDAAWSPDGSVLAIAGKDKHVHVLDVRSSKSKARALGHVAAHDSPRSFSILWLDGEHLLSVGHTFGSMRQLKLYRIDPDTGELSSIAKENLDASPSILFPVWDPDTNVLWLWSKGERIVSAYEVQPDDKDVFTVLPAFQHGQPQLGLAFLPKDCVDVRNVELGKAIRLSKTELQHVVWNVPRSRPEYFQDDVYPPTVIARQPVLDTAVWLAGRDAYPIPRETLQPEDMTPLSQAPPPRAKQSNLSKGPTMRELTAKEREDQALQSVFEKAKGRDEGKDPNHNEDQAARAPDNDDWNDSD